MKTELSQRVALAMRLVIASACTVVASIAAAAQPSNASALADAYTSTPAAPTSNAQYVRSINADEIQVNRYTTLNSQPDETDSYALAVTAKVHFPRGVVSTVGDAVKYLLIRTGYELAPAEQMDEHVRRVFGLRLPESNRVMGPYRVDAMLRALMGRAFSLNVDQNLRIVSYASNNPPAAPQAAAPTASEPAKGEEVGTLPAPSSSNQEPVAAKPVAKFSWRQTPQQVAE